MLSLSRAALAAALVVITACGKVGASDAPDVDPPDAAAVDPADAVALAPPDAGVDADVPTVAKTWSPLALVAVDTAVATLMPNPSGDGRTLYFNGKGPFNGTFDILMATRATPDGDFGAPVLLPEREGARTEQRYPDVSGDGLTVCFTSGSAIQVVNRASVSADFGEVAPTTAEGNFCSLTRDGRTLYYLAAVDGVVGEVRSISRMGVGQPWSAPTVVPLPVPVQIYSAIDISEDELSLLIAPPFTKPEQPHEVKIVRRAARGEPFRDVSVAFTVEYGWAFNSARWGRGDTEIWVGQLKDGLERPFVSRLR